MLKPTTVIAFYNTCFRAPISDYSPTPILKGTECELTADRKRLNEADAVIFHLPDMGDITHMRKAPGQLWVLWCEECDENYPAMQYKRFMDLFDIKMTYQLNADVIAGYFDRSFEKSFRVPVPPKSQDLLCCAFISSSVNQSKRLGYLMELMKHIDIHSYGRALNNRQITDDQGRSSKINIVSKYKFYLAFENAISKDYVTEKFFDGLGCGTVPIYLGAPNIDEFAPGYNSFININSFRRPKDLASYLVQLNKDDSAYNSYFEWKKQPFKESFNTLINKHPTSLFHSLYEEIKRRKSIM